MVGLLMVLFALSSVLSLDCGTFDAASCASNGCEWVASSKSSCSPPTAATCGAGNTWLTCVEIPGCEWHNPASGTCSEPEDDSDCAGKDSTSCGNTVGCTFYPVSTECAIPSIADCLFLTQANCEIGNSGCKWNAGSGSCKYPSVGYCEYLAEDACKSAVGCEYHEVKGLCMAPTNADCVGLDESECVSSKRGCKIEPPHFSCEIPERTRPCGSHEEKGECEADTVNACNWQDPEVTCSRPSCALLSPTQCEAPGSGCELVDDQYECSGYSDCNQLKNEGDCRNQFCEWKWEFRGNCQLREGCQNLGESDCTNGCSWTNSSTRCVGNPECTCFKDSESCNAAYSGCSWAKSSCEKSTSNCTAGADGACTSEAIRSKCRTEIDPGQCNADTDLDCESNEDKTGCNETISDVHCSWHPARGVCQNNNELNCSDATVRDQCVMEGCSWKLVQRKSCQVAEGHDCRVNDASSDCLGDPSCKLETTHPGFCYGNNPNNPRCYPDSTNSGCACGTDGTCQWKQVQSAGCFADHNIVCSIFSSSETCHGNTGCKWSSGYGYCSKNDQDIRCYDDAGKTRCDPESDPFCKWEAQAVGCVPDEKLNCSIQNPDKTCPSGSNPGCQNITKPAHCGVSTGLYCVTDATNNGCTANSDPGCKWKAASSSGSCTPRSEMQSKCVVDATNSECTGYSKSIGCVLVGGCKAPENRGSTASALIIPMMILVLLTLFV